jgi:selenocysteine-specific elongation factor
VYVVATAGHVDHGKSTLVRALTGQDPDRLEEEHRRGLSIELGYVWTRLEGLGDVAFVDVPGHQRFVTTTLAGVGPVPVVLFVVAADDPWMPQAAEHLAALDALGVTHGVLVVTRADLADPAPALGRAQAELARTSLARVPAVTVSGRTGDGLDELRRALAAELLTLPQADPAADVRLWIDRAFHVRGAGTVVTGTLPAGTVRIGDPLSLGAGTVRVRSLESLEVAHQRIFGVARVALNLAGEVPEDLARGEALLTPGAFVLTEVVDVRVRGEGDVPERPVLHVGATHVGVHARPLARAVLRLTLERALPLRARDRALLRDPGSRTIWGLEVLDPQPGPLTRRGAAAARVAELEKLDGTTAAYVAMRGLVRRSELRRIGFPADVPTDVLTDVPGSSVAGDWVLDAGRVRELRTLLEELVRAQTGTDRLTTAAAAHALGLPDVGLVRALVQPPLRVAGGEISVDRATPHEWASALRALRDVLDADPFAAPETGRLRDLGLDVAAQARLHRDGHLLRLAENVVLLPGADDQAVERLRALPQPFTTSQARQCLATTRRVALPLLAHLDRTRRTVRLPDDTRRLV